MHNDTTDRCYRHCFECVLPPEHTPRRQKKAGADGEGPEAGGGLSSSNNTGRAGSGERQSAGTSHDSGGAAPAPALSTPGGVVVVDRALASNDPKAFARDYLGAFMAVHAAQPVDRQAALHTL
jgi:hypothetical protein